MDNNKVTILIPAYNVASFLPKCLETVLGQTYTDLQVVVVDDGSRDDTLAVANAYAEKDVRLEVYHQGNLGVATTRNNLLDHVKGDWVLFVDADDWIELDMVEYLVNLAQGHSADFVMCDRVINDAEPSHEEPKVFELDQEHAIVDFLHHGYFVGSLCNKLLSSRLLHNERFHRGISYGEDAIFCWGVLQKTQKVVVSSKQLYHYYMNEESISHQTFGEKKLTGHQTWTIISEDVKKSWPQYTDLALGTFALQDIHLLQAAAQSRYRRDNYIIMLQTSVREKWKYLKYSKIRSKKQWFYAFMICRFYWFGYIYKILNIIKEKI